MAWTYSNERNNEVEWDGTLVVKKLKGKTVEIANNGRWITPYIFAVNTTSQTATAGTVLLFQFEVPTDVIVDGIGLRHSSASGAAICGIYKPTSFDSDDCFDGALLVESSSTTLSGTTQVITFTPTKLESGVYYAAVEYELAAHSFFRFGNTTQQGGTTQLYARAGGYGALTNPCPSTTGSLTAFPNILIRRSA